MSDLLDQVFENLLSSFWLFWIVWVTLSFIFFLVEVLKDNYDWWDITLFKVELGMGYRQNHHNLVKQLDRVIFNSLWGWNHYRHYDSCYSILHQFHLWFQNIIRFFTPNFSQNFLPNISLFSIRIRVTEPLRVY